MEAEAETKTETHTSTETTTANEAPGAETASPAPPPSEESKDGGGEPQKPDGDGEKVSFILAFKKQTFNVDFGIDRTVGDLRQEVARLSGVPAALQKLMLKGMLKNDSDTLRTAGFKNGVKVMLIGSTIQDVLTTASTDAAAATASSSSAVSEKEYMSEKLPHKKIIDKGKPEDVMPGIKFSHDPLPEIPLYGILNNRGDKVRLTFKVFQQELWISSKSSTQKIPFMTVKGVQYEAIKGQEEYHIVSLQLGNTDATRYFLYWVPAQYSRAISTTIMGYM